MYSTFNNTKLRSEFLDEREQEKVGTLAEGSYVIELEDDEVGDNAIF